MMLENRHEILAEIISKYEDARSVVCFSDLERIFVKTLALLGECIGYIDAVKGGDIDAVKGGDIDAVKGGEEE